MKRGILLIIITIALAFSYAFLNNNITGRTISDMQGPPPGAGAPEGIGPEMATQECMMACTAKGCANPSDTECRMKNGPKCQAECNAYKPEPADEGQACMEECVVQGCGEVDFACQETNRARCENECGMIKEPEARSEEEACIRECVRKIDSALICRPGEGGEQGNEICQNCAAECVQLYAGPCLSEEKLEAKKQACVTCEHCYGEPVLGDSGEGYQCIVDVECRDASAEWGDEPGSGPGIGQEGFAARTAERIGNVFERVGDFFKGLFGVGDKETTAEETFEPEEAAMKESSAEDAGEEEAGETSAIQREMPETGERGQPPAESAPLGE